MSLETGGVPVLLFYSRYQHFHLHFPDFVWRERKIPKRKQACALVDELITFFRKADGLNGGTPQGRFAVDPKNNLHIVLAVGGSEFTHPFRFPLTDRAAIGEMVTGGEDEAVQHVAPQKIDVELASKISCPLFPRSDW